MEIKDKIWRREWDSDSDGSIGFCKLQIPQCRGCQESQRCRGALPAIARVSRPGGAVVVRVASGRKDSVPQGGRRRITGGTSSWSKPQTNSRRRFHASGQGGLTRLCVSSASRGAAGRAINDTDPIGVREIGDREWYVPFSCGMTMTDRRECGAAARWIQGLSWVEPCRPNGRSQRRCRSEKSVSQAASYRVHRRRAAYLCFISRSLLKRSGITDLAVDKRYTRGIRVPSGMRADRPFPVR